jgi:hypothetical protein
MFISISMMGSIQDPPMSNVPNDQRKIIIIYGMLYVYQRSSVR